MIDLQGACQFDASDTMQAGADGATTLRAVRSSAKNTRFNASMQIRGIIGGHFREEAFIRIFRRVKESFPKVFIEEELRISRRQRRQLPGQGLAVLRTQHFDTLLTDLRSVDA